MQDKLKAVFNKNTDGQRYVPRSINGGTGWEVWDKKERRFLTNNDVRNTSIDELRDEPLETN